MSGSRSHSSWLAPLLLLLPVALFAGWVAGELPVHGRSARDDPGNKSGLVPDVAPAQPSALTRGRPAGTETPPTSDGAPVRQYDTVFSTWTTYDVAVRESRANGKAIMLDFNAEWDGPCQALHQEVFVHEAAGTTVKAAVIPVSIVDRVRENGSNSAQVEELERRFKVEVFPTLVIFSPATGRAVRRTGYAGAQETLRWITEGAIAVLN